MTPTDKPNKGEELTMTLDGNSVDGDSDAALTSMTPEEIEKKLEEDEKKRQAQK